MAELQYIYNTASASFSIPISDFSSTRKIEFKLAFSQIGFNHIIKAGGDYGDFVIRYFQSRFDVYLSQMGSVIPSPQPVVNEPMTCVWDAVNNICTFNGIDYTITGNPTPNGNTVVIGNNWLITFYYMRFYDENNTILHSYVPYDNNGSVGIMDNVTNTFYSPSNGSYIAGPVAHIFAIDKSNTRFDATGGTETVEIEAETTWTASTPSFVSVSPSTGDTGTTQVTITCPSYTGATRREDVITFTDNDNYTLTFKARQNGNSAGFSNIYLGDNNLLSNTIYLGDNAVNTIYLGEEIIYSNGPFVGLKAAPQSLELNNLNPTANITIRSSENWTITDNSTVGGYYTLQNYTAGCDGWVPSYDGSLDGGEISEYGLWFEWEHGLSMMTFQEYVENLAANGITVTGTPCPNARYSIYLQPHTTGGPGWLSYSQTTGGTGKTVVTVTASTTQADRTATITLTSENYTATIGVTQKPVMYRDLYVNGTANIVTDFNPYTFYTQNNNYMKIVLCHDYSQGNNGYLYKTPTNWFTFEDGMYGCYFNAAGTTGLISTDYLPDLRTTNTTGNPITVILDNGTANGLQGEDTQTNTFTGNMPNANLIFYETSSSRNYKGHLYSFAVYGQNDVLAHWYVGYDDGVNVGIEDLVTGNKFQPNGSNYTIQCSDL